MSENKTTDHPETAAELAASPHVQKLLQELETVSQVADFEIGSRFQSLATQYPELAQDSAWRAEAIGFGFMENTNEAKNDGDFYVPTVTWVTGDGGTHGTPDVSLIKPEMIQYWVRRCGETNNPLLKARYSGLVWEFGKRITDEKPPHEMARAHVEALVTIAEQGLAKFEVDAIRKLGRALDIACSLNSPELIQKVKQTILGYEDRIAVDEMLGLWGFSFDLLIGNKCANITATEETKIIADLVARFDRLCKRKSGDPSDPFRCEAGASRLAEYYRTQGRSDDVAHVIRKLGEAFTAAMDVAAPLQALSWAEHLHGVNMIYQLHEDAEAIARRMRELGPKVRGDMKVVSQEIELPRKEIEELINKLTDGGFEQSLGQIAASFIPKRKVVEDLLNQLAKTAPLQAHIPKHLTDAEGRLVSIIGPLREDLDGNVVHQMSQNMQVQGVLLNAVIDEARRKYQLSAESLTGYLYRSPAFAESHKSIIAKGLTAYFVGDHLAAAHLLIPQIESAARVLLELAGGAILKPRRDGGGFDLKTLGEVLYEEPFKKVFSEDFALYLRVLLTDPRGWNLRNTVMHGAQPDMAFTPVMLDRVVHVLLCFALVQATPVS